VLMRFTAFYCVLLRFIAFYCVLLRFTAFSAFSAFYDVMVLLLIVNLIELESTLKEHETNIADLSAKLAKETDRTGSLGESVTTYEKKLKELEGRMWDNLNKEAQRRTEAESKAKRLKKKVCTSPPPPAPSPERKERMEGEVERRKERTKEKEGAVEGEGR
jgi:cell division protein FtsL